jgi:hypothetical protein
MSQLYSCQNSLAVTLWFVGLGIWRLRRLMDQLDDLAKQAREKMQLSEIRYIFELLKAETYRIAESEFITICDT